ncbi:DUF6124 family protein [Pseudomonas fluorescens]
MTGKRSNVQDHAKSAGTGHRKTALGIAQVVMLGELAVNRALDKVVPVD